MELLRLLICLARIRLNAVFGSMQMVALFHCTHQPKLHGHPPAEHSLLFAYYPKPQLLEGERILKSPPTEQNCNNSPKCCLANTRGSVYFRHLTTYQTTSGPIHRCTSNPMWAKNLIKVLEASRDRAWSARLEIL